MEGIKNWWNGFTEKHPKASKWIREGGLFIIISYVVTFLKYLIMLFLPNLFSAFASNGWGWPNAEFTVHDITFTFNIIGYAVEDGGLAYCLAVWISIVFGELINFPLQRKFTFHNDGPLALQVPIYAIGVVVVNMVLNAFNSIWVGLAKYLVPAVVYNIVTTVVAGGVCMAVFFVIDKIIFAPDFGN